MAISNNSTGLRPGVCTSSTRPTAPYTGQLIFETDTFSLKFWNGSTWQGAVSAPAGTVNTYAGATAPSGWLLAYGQAISRTTYADLFAVVGTTYGAGDGSTTFGLPDLRGRAVAGKDDMGGSAASRITSAVTGITGTTLGSAGGNQNVHQHTHTQDSHNHSQNAHTHAQVYNGAPTGASLDGSLFAYGTVADLTWRGVNISSTTATNIAATATNQNFGTGSSQNLQPTIILNYIIKF